VEAQAGARALGLSSEGRRHLGVDAQRGFAFTAAGAAARINGRLTPELYAALRAEGIKRCMAGPAPT
jgi:hypothetical protein